MDRETLETLCRSFADRQSSGLPIEADHRVDPVPEILRSFRLAEISVAEMESLLGLVSDAYAGEDAGPAYGLALAGFDDGLDEPPVLVDDVADCNAVVVAGRCEDDEDLVIPPDSRAVVAVRISPTERGAEVVGMPPRGD